MLSLRLKITIFVLVGALTEAFLLGGIGYLSVDAVSGHTKELRWIATALDGTQRLNMALSQLSHPNYISEQGLSWDSERFLSDMASMERQVRICASTSCHGVSKTPPRMAQSMLDHVGSIREQGMGLFRERTQENDFPVERWLEIVEGPAHEIMDSTNQMSNVLAGRARDLESSARRTERAATIFVSLATLLCVLLAVSLSHPMAASITRPLVELEGKIRHVASGDLGKRVGGSATLEVHRLATSFNLMSARLLAARQALERHQVGLEQAIQDRIQELRRKDEELHQRERLSTVGLVASSVAHDLHNPLSAILLNAEVLLEAIGEEDGNRQVLVDILEDARRCRAIANEMRDLIGRQDVRPSRLGAADLESLATEAIRLLQFKWTGKGVAVRFDSLFDEQSELTCTGEGPRILQALVNLVDNAIGATPAGGEVRVSVGRRGGEVFFEVEDSGPGIPAEHRHLFSRPFFSTKTGGLGLGLSICRRIADQHDGRIEWETRTREEIEGDGSDRRSGTVLRLLLPCSGKEEER